MLDFLFVCLLAFGFGMEARKNRQKKKLIPKAQLKLIFGQENMKMAQHAYTLSRPIYLSSSQIQQGIGFETKICHTIAEQSQHEPIQKVAIVITEIDFFLSSRCIPFVHFKGAQFKANPPNPRYEKDRLLWARAKCFSEQSFVIHHQLMELGVDFEHLGGFATRIWIKNEI